MSRTMDGLSPQQSGAEAPAVNYSQNHERDALPSSSHDHRNTRDREQVFQGKILSPGIGFGRACFYHAPENRRCSSLSSGNDSARLREVMQQIAVYLGRLGHEADARLSCAAGDIFRAQRMLVEDPALIEILETTLWEVNGSIESAVSLTFDRLIEEMQSAAMDNIRERAHDFVELKELISGRLTHQQTHLSCEDTAWCQPGECLNGCDHILLATRLSPGITIGANHHTVGFVVETGGPSSHAAILARMMGLPAVSGISNLLSAIPSDGQVLVDGNSGKVYVNPTLETLARYHERQSNRAGAIETSIAPVPGLRIMADLERVEDIPKALVARAEGVGLYRSETEPLVLQRCLTEEEQLERYVRLLEAFPSGHVCVRLLDLGADKAADWLQMPVEDNPALGCRGARLLLARPELLRTQARALARASQGHELRVMYPMVHSVNQFLQLRTLFNAAIDDISNARLLHGAMFEVPAACIEAKTFFEHIDFGRIGTNDLTQYLFAADRTNSAIDQYELFEEPALWSLIEDTARAAADAGKPLSICGELAADPKYTRRIQQAGITEVSVSPHRITALRLAAAP